MNLTKNRVLLIGIVAIAAAGAFIAWYGSVPSSFKCPNDYATAEEYVKGVTEWASEQLMNSPNMTKEELLNERERQFREHACEPSRWPNLPGGF
ncbi:hypothetical protein A3I46_01925 [Candidatus Kaiserbacteria bacterium RIFCSPLOWO2_02_FULL_54_13]|uniref:Uncharacterized protein n=1 Tax=Candidatus Kaiserbacteria bacterium RIFCSPHIGHO2_02_FULL_54_22 TaxID=1798495 RepID=A0A1F6DKX3_9BACT|nr:MAG: hypothetical protein A3C19_00065 [Candidatus Kaiserbacteria bacterium RIFCSPHIGHO2_02_FULL_54_22]OGG67955.1 MAG: hypothetical protein A3E99_01320 [Candidatus Kaiserbacteria bacterium RIFCSPHIGHO2_12_FULL_54_16]OGG84094.1 MAG: hypothetical protein A3I46_01925 [Candidatus Kaiserbacteria bacterium RIFCSPLOWO2_02_FULL_54_13]OGG90827.1 MAG: hypothetical protein A3G12_03095 [Candidatus Kaiserbacteria bacterium RIFCSPLOWO2_12_FULL_54_10]